MSDESNKGLVNESMGEFYRRARKGFREPASSDAIDIGALNQLIECHLVAKACLDAISDSAAHSDKFKQLAHSQSSHIEELSALVKELGGSPPRVDEAKADLPHMPDEFRDELATDRLEAMLQSNRQFVREKYKELAESTDISEELGLALVRLN